MDPIELAKRLSLTFFVFVFLTSLTSAATLTTDLCEKETGMCMMQCYLVLANATADESVCSENLASSGGSLCYLAVAMAKKDSGVCPKMTAKLRENKETLFMDEDSIKLMEVLCYAGVAEAAKDLSACDNIKNTSLREDCIQATVSAMGDRGLCDSELSEPERIYRCYGAVAEDTKDANLCELIPSTAGSETIVGTRDACFMDVAEETENFALCEKVSSDWITQCYVDVAKKDLKNPRCNDAAIFSKGGQELANGCWYSAAGWASKPEYCDNIKQIGSGEEAQRSHNALVSYCKEVSAPSSYSTQECSFRSYDIPGKAESCPEGYVRENGECVAEEFECPEGYREEDGACVPIENLRSVTLDKDQAETFGNGKDTLELTLTIVGEDGKPLAGEKAEVEIYDYTRLLIDEGNLSTTSVTTSADGKAKFTYTAPLPPEGKRFKPYQLLVRAKHAWGNPGCYVIIKDARPKLSIEADPRVVNEDEGTGEGISYFTVDIDDPDSSKWTYRVSTSLGSIAGGEGETTEKEFKFRWIAPDSKVAIRDFELTMDRDDAAAYSTLATNLKRAGNSLINDPDENQQAARINYFKDLNSSWNYVKEDYNRLNSGTYSGTETALNMLSFGLEGLQVWAASKGLYDAEKEYGGGVEDSMIFRVKNALTGTRDAFIGYGVDLLQSRLRSWADAEHQANLESIRVPVKVTVTAVDETGQQMTLNYLIQYRYQYNPKVHFDRINNPEAG